MPSRCAPSCMAFVERDPRAASRPPVTGEEGVASLEIAMRCLEGAAASQAASRRRKAAPRRRLTPSARASRLVTAMNQHARVDMRPIPFIDVAAQRRRLGTRDRRGDRARAGPLPVHHGPGGRGVRDASSPPSAAPPRDRLRQRHRCAGAGADGQGHRPRRCGVLSGLHLLRDRGGRGAGRRDAGVRRRRATPSTSIAASLKRAIATAKRQGLKPKAVIPVDLFGLPADHDAIAAVAQGGRPVRARRRRAGFGAHLQGPQARHARATRRRPASSRPSRSAATATAARCSPTTTSSRAILKSLRVHGAGRRQIRQCAHRHDRPARHHPGRGADREAEDLPRRDRRAQPRRRGATPRRSPMSRPCRGARRADLGLGAIHHPAASRAARRARRRAARRKASRPRSTIPSRCTGRRPIAHFPVADGGLPVTERLADEVISLPMHAYLDEPTQDRIIAAVRRALRQAACHPRQGAGSEPAIPSQA